MHHCRITTHFFLFSYFIVYIYVFIGSYSFSLTFSSLQFIYLYSSIVSRLLSFLQPVISFTFLLLFPSLFFSFSPFLLDFSSFFFSFIFFPYRLEQLNISQNYTSTFSVGVFVSLISIGLTGATTE